MCFVRPATWRATSQDYPNHDVVDHSDDDAIAYQPQKILRHRQRKKKHVIVLNEQQHFYNSIDMLANWVIQWNDSYLPFSVALFVSNL